MTVGDQLTTDVWFAQCKLEQTANPINAATARSRHAVECVRNAAHTAIECRSGVFIPSIAMSAAHADSTSVKSFYRLKPSRQFGRERQPLQHVWVFEQLPHSSR